MECLEGVWGGVSPAGVATAGCEVESEIVAKKNAGSAKENESHSVCLLRSK